VVADTSGRARGRARSNHPGTKARLVRAGPSFRSGRARSNQPGEDNGAPGRGRRATASRAGAPCRSTARKREMATDAGGRNKTPAMNASKERRFRGGRGAGDETRGNSLQLDARAGRGSAGGKCGQTNERSPFQETTRGLLIEAGSRAA